MLPIPQAVLYTVQCTPLTPAPSFFRALSFALSPYLCSLAHPHDHTTPFTPALSLSYIPLICTPLTPALYPSPIPPSPFLRYSLATSAVQYPSYLLFLYLICKLFTSAICMLPSSTVHYLLYFCPLKDRWLYTLTDICYLSLLYALKMKLKEAA